MSETLNQIQQILKQHATAEGKAAHLKFVPGATKVFGVRMPVLNELARQFKPGGFSLIKELWAAGSLEEKTLAVKLLGKIARKDPGQALAMIRHFATNIDNWAVCDAMGMQGLKPILKTHRREIFELATEYNSSEDPWQRRLSLVLVEWYTRFPEYHKEIKKLVKQLENDKEYYVKKAIVWINRNLEKGR